jgi:hypothetical protein
VPGADLLHTLLADEGIASAVFRDLEAAEAWLKRQHAAGELPDAADGVA